MSERDTRDPSRHGYRAPALDEDYAGLSRGYAVSNRRMSATSIAARSAAITTSQRLRTR